MPEDTASQNPITIPRIASSARNLICLRGPLSGDSTARVLHSLIIGVLAWIVLQSTVLVPFFVPRMTALSVGSLLIVSASVLAETLLRRGRLRAASVTYMLGVWVASTATIVLNGGIHSVALVYYITLPITGAWLFGFHAALRIAGFCVGSSLIMALLEMLGVSLPLYFPAEPLAVWTTVTAATIMAAVPVSRVLQIHKEALANYQVAEDAIWEYQGHLEELVQERTAELVDARDQAQAASRAKSVFLANMSHELRTPLNAILGFSNLVQCGSGLSDGQRKDLETISRSGEHLLDLIDEVLDLAKIEAGGMAVKVSVLNPRRLVHEVVDLMREKAHAKNLQFLFDNIGQPLSYVRSDAARLRQVMLNLIGNAVKYTEQGSVTLRLGLSPADRSGRMLLTLEVLDTGIGIELCDQQRIFEPSVQLGKCDSPKGTGLGLSISRKVIEAMGGSLLVESTPGVGSLFHVELPVECAEAGELPEPEMEPNEVIGLAPGQPEYRMLIIEETHENSTLLQRLLQDAGFRVCVAENGSDGVEVFRIWHPHLIWLETELSGMSATETAQCVRQLEGGNDVKIVALTPSPSASERDSVLAAGMDDVLGKPYRKREIFDCMNRNLGIRYIYGTGTGAVLPVEQNMALSREAVSVLPEELREELESALILLDVSRVTTSIRRVTECDPVLGGVMASLAAKLAYTSILHAVATHRAGASEG